MSQYDEKHFKTKIQSLLIKDSLSKLGINANVKVRIDNSNKLNYMVDSDSISLVFHVRNMHIDDTIDRIESWFKKELDLDFDFTSDVNVAREAIYNKWWNEIDPLLDELYELDLDEEELLMRKDKLVMDYYKEHNYNLIVSHLEEIEYAQSIVRAGDVSNGKSFHVGWKLEFEHEALIEGDGKHKASIEGFFNRTKCYINSILPYHLNGTAIFDLDSEEGDSQVARNFAYIDIEPLIEIVELCYENMVPKLGLYDQFFEDYEYTYSEYNELIIAQAENIDWECSFDNITMKLASNKLIRKKINGVSYIVESNDDDDDELEDFDDF